MAGMLLVHSAAAGVLWINGLFCGPLEREGQAFPAGRDAEIYLQLFPLGQADALTVQLLLRGGRIERLWPKESAFALIWPEGVIQLELCPREGQGQERQEERAAGGTLMRYLLMRLAGDPQAGALLMRPQEAPEIAGYEAAVPLRCLPQNAPQWADERAGLVRRIGDNIAAVDAALAATVPAGQGKKRIERIAIIRTPG